MQRKASALYGQLTEKRVLLIKKLNGNFFF